MTTDELEVHVLGMRAGTLRRNRRGLVSFAYTPEYAAGGAPALTPALPLSDKAYGGTPLQAYIAGLLPDDASVRQRWATEFSVPDDPYDLLAHMGLDCVGAVQFCPPNTNIDRPVRYEPVTDSDIAARIRDLRHDPSSWTLPDEAWSLPGAQEKFALARLEGQWFEATEAAPTTHIVKPGVAKMRAQAEVEFATMRAASLLGLAVAPVEMLRFEDESAIAIERYDRRIARGVVRRIHQVDFCQALGVLPSSKYEVSGGPTSEQLVNLVRKVSTNPEADVRRLSDAMLFNYLSGSPDGHAKNFSLVFAGTQTRLAPLYDLATGLPYDARDAARTAAFHVGGVRRFGESYPKHWRAHAKAFRLDPDERINRILEFAQELPRAFHDALMNELGGEIGANLWLRLEKRLVPACERVLKRWKSHG